MPRTRFVLTSGLLLATLAFTGCPGGDTSTTDTSNTTKKKTKKKDKKKPPVPIKKEPFDLAKAKTPWKHSKVGDWATYKLHPPVNKTFKFKITKVEGTKVTFTRMDAEAGDKVLDETTIDMEEEEGRYKDPMTYDGLAKDDKGNDITPYKESVEINGKKIEALVIKRAREGMGSTELWMCEADIRPFMQCSVKSIRDGALMSELIDFGKAE